MTEKKDTSRHSSSNKNLLYSEILNTSVTDHVRELLQKKNRSFTTHHVQRSAVLDRVSKILQSYKAGEDKNVEEIEEGEPVINMSVTLIEKNESVSEDDSESGHEDLEKDGVKITMYSDSESEHEDLEKDGVKITLYSDSESEQCKNKSLVDESGSNSYDSDSEMSVDETYESMKYLMSSDLVNKLPEIRKFKCEDICALSSDTDDEQPENSDDEQPESEGKDVILEAKTLHIPSESNDETPEEGSKVNIEGNNYLEPSQSDFGLLISDKCKYQGYKHDLGLYGKSKKLISVIEDDENISFSKKQKRV